jgi:hypothetical protein
MKYGRARRIQWIYLALVTACMSTVLLAGPGFGGLGGLRKKTLELNTRAPALVRLANTSIAFQNAYTNREYAPVVESLATALGTELVSNEKTLIEKEKPADAAWVLRLTVTGYSAGLPRQHNETIGTSTATYQQWTGSLNAAYQVIDKTGRVHDASNVSTNYNKDFPVGTTTSSSRWSIPGLANRHGGKSEPVPNSPEDVKQILIRDVVEQIAAKLGNTTKSVEVQVATGDSHLDRAAEFLEQRLWTRAVEELEKTPPFAKPDQEAYRQYDLGLAYEAVSYSSANTDEQKENLFKAQEYYDKAVEMNTKEKYFVATVARTRDALARYKELEAQAQTSPKPAIAKSEVHDDALESTRKPAHVDPPVEKPDPNPGKLLTVNDVIEMYNDKVPQDQIIDVIQNSSVDFNPHDKDTVIAMSKARLPASLQNALRTKVGAATTKPVVARPSSKTE